MKFSKNKFTKHTILESIDDTAVWASTRVVWCKLDQESEFHRNQSGLRVSYVWLVSEDLKFLHLLSLDAAKQKLSPPQRAETKVVLDGKNINTVLSKIKAEKARILSTKIRDAVLQHTKLSLDNDWVHYQYDYDIPLSIVCINKKILSISYGQEYKIMRVQNNNNKLVFENLSPNVFTISDQKLAILHYRARVK